jgi:hypothetical protein
VAVKVLRPELAHDREVVHRDRLRGGPEHAGLPRR